MGEGDRGGWGGPDPGPRPPTRCLRPPDRWPRPRAQTPEPLDTHTVRNGIRFLSKGCVTTDKISYGLFLKHRQAKKGENYLCSSLEAVPLSSTLGLLRCLQLLYAYIHMSLNRSCIRIAGAHKDRRRLNIC